MKPIRVVHIVWSLGVGGLEAFLRNAVRPLASQGVASDFLVFQRCPGAGFEEEVRSSGAAIFSVSPYEDARWFGPKVMRALKEHGPYDIAHCHFVPPNYPLIWARFAGIRSRLLHLRQSSFGWPRPPLMERACLAALRKPWAGQDATRVLAVSRCAARSWYPSLPDTENPSDVVYSGIPLDAFRGGEDGAAVRKSLGLNPGDWVMGHVGRLAKVKNHAFLIDVFTHAARLAPEAKLLLIGEGPESPALLERVRLAGLAGRVIFAGRRTDVERLLLGAVDCFVFPSLSEGLPLSVLQAQAAGVPVLLSDAVTDEVSIVPGLVRRLPLADSAEDWARAALSHARGFPLDRAAALACVGRSPFTLEKSVDRLLEIYREEVAAHG